MLTYNVCIYINIYAHIFVGALFKIIMFHIALLLWGLHRHKERETITGLDRDNTLITMGLF